MSTPEEAEAKEVLASLSRRLDILYRAHLPVHAPVVLDILPPNYARLAYKAVALVDGVAYSIFDGTTRFDPGTTVYHPAAEDHGGGLYVFRTLEECLARDDQMFPRNCALLDAPRGIARVMAWNPDGTLPVSYGSKKSFSYLHVIDVMPVPATWELMRGRPYSAAAAPDRLRSSQAPRDDATASGSAAGSGGWVATSGGSSSGMGNGSGNWAAASAGSSGELTDSSGSGSGSSGRYPRPGTSSGHGVGSGPGMPSSYSRPTPPRPVSAAVTPRRSAHSYAAGGSISGGARGGTGIGGLASPSSPALRRPVSRGSAGGGSPSLIRRQAGTLQLEMEVREMELKLAVMRGEVTATSPATSRARAW